MHYPKTVKLESSKTITRAELADVLVRNIGFSRQECFYMIDWVLEQMFYKLISEKEVKISGFGSFILRDKKARIGRNPKTGIEAEISRRRVVLFRPSPLLKKEINSFLKGST